MATKRTKKCPECKGTGRVKIDSEGLTKKERKKIEKKYSEMDF